MMSQHRNIDVKEIFVFPLGPVPWALADSMGTLKKTNKAILMHDLEKMQSQMKNTCTVIDGMALVRKIKTVGLTYGEFALKLFNTALSKNSSSARADVVYVCIGKFQLKMLNVLVEKVVVLSSRRL